MFSIDDDDINFSDEEINFSILNTPIPNQTKQKSNASNRSSEKRIFDGNRSPINQKGTISSSSIGNDTVSADQVEIQSNLLETPKTKRFKFVKTSTSADNQSFSHQQRNNTPNLKQLKSTPQRSIESPKVIDKNSESFERFKLSNITTESNKCSKTGKKGSPPVKAKNNKCFDVPDNFFDDDDDELLSQVDLRPINVLTSNKETREPDIKKPTKSDVKMKQPGVLYSSNPNQQNMRRSSNITGTKVSTEMITSISNHVIDRKQSIGTPSNSNSKCMRKSLSTPIAKNKQAFNNNLIKTPKNFAQNNRRASRTPGETSQRKFPGPAGNLPKLDNINELDKLKSPELTLKGKSITPNAPRTPLQMIQSTPEESCHTESFSTMLEYVSNHFPNETLLSINEVLYKSSQRKLDNCKVPLLCGVIKSFSIVNNSGRLVLEDSTGEINGAIHNDILDEYQKGLGKGSGLILKDVSVFSPTIKRHYLNITPLNIAAFFERDPADDQLTQFTQVSNNSTIILDSDN